MFILLRQKLQLHYANSFLKCCSIYEIFLHPVYSRKLSISNAVKSTLPKISIARQPVPDLDKTLSKYLRFVSLFL